ncbi:uncharacterized protein LOC110382798 [Helicoverpa armigera]|uniref:uncharacterized protein LOC110382798 n=1 Tax=Helicoverpa armigera TaxID=29058 RepID=UPI003083CF16
MRYLYIFLLILSLSAIKGSVYTNLKDNVLRNAAMLDESKKDTGASKSPTGSMRYYQNKKQQDEKDKKSAQNKATVLKKVRTHEDTLNLGKDIASKMTENIDKRIAKEYFLMDPVLNELRHRRYRGLAKSKDFRRHKKQVEEEEPQTSSDLEMKFWLDEWDEHWMQKKFEALNSSQPRGDVVNMAAARPWAVPCGDPNQHDMPWGNCMLPPECDAEYRIYRGDSFCGRTAYVCCGLQVTNYDMYQGLDISFEGSSFSTDSNEKNAQTGSKEEDNKKKEAERNKRKRDRDRRKRKIRESIRRIVSEIQKILDRAYRNGTTQRKRKTKELKKFIELLKKQFRKDRKSIVNVHQVEMVKIDDGLQARLDQIGDMNENFMSNDTFRDIVVNGTVNKDKLAQYIRVHPELAKIFKNRRMGSIEVNPEKIEEPHDPGPLGEQLTRENKEPVIDYDVEYGMLYY